MQNDGEIMQFESFRTHFVAIFTKKRKEAILQDVPFSELSRITVTGERLKLIISVIIVDCECTFFEWIDFCKFARAAVYSCRDFFFLNAVFLENSHELPCIPAGAFFFLKKFYLS